MVKTCAVNELSRFYVCKCPLGAADEDLLVHSVPQRPCLSVVSLSVIVDTDVSVVLVSDAGLTQVLGVVAPGVMLCLLDPWHAAIAKELPHIW